MDFESEQKLQPYLESVERLLWTGRPRQGMRLTGGDILLIPFSLFWCGFAIFWELGVISQNGSLGARLWGVPFILIGLYLVVGRFFFDARIRARTYYGLTDRRILILSGYSKLEVKSFEIKSLSRIRLSKSRDGKGTIWLGTSASRGSGAATNGSLVPRLDTIDNVESVYHQMMELQTDKVWR
ncbi:MAG TPA: hypothetical protein VJ983_10600 [candidate division Zixibacteria bacterium]|nr:hypothetical protein [candidate division Zixibacteria bacterium]